MQFFPSVNKDSDRVAHSLSPSISPISIQWLHRCNACSSRGRYDMLQTSAWLQRQSSQEDEFLHFDARVQCSSENAEDGSGDTFAIFHDMHACPNIKICIKICLIGSVVITADYTLLIHQSRGPVSFSSRQTTAATTANLSPHFGLQTLRIELKRVDHSLTNRQKAHTHSLTP